MKNNILYLISVICIILSIYFFTKKENNQYNISEYLNKYDNTFRIKNNIPIIPQNWVLDDKGKYGIDNFHSPNMQQLGRRIKYINLLKDNLGAEMDHFYLTKDSVLVSRFEVKLNRKLLYIYLESNLNYVLISRDSANDLLKKHKINFEFDSSWNIR